MLTTTKPDQHVFCQFNAHLAHKYLIVLNEVKSFQNMEGQLKSLITDDTIAVEVKFGSNGTEINSYHRFIMTAQPEYADTIPTCADERRYFIIRCSDELCNDNVEHHAFFADLIKRESAQRDFYDFLMSRRVNEIIGKDDIDAAMTDFHREINVANRDVIEQFVVALAYGETTPPNGDDEVDDAREAG